MIVNNILWLFTDETLHISKPVTASKYHSILWDLLPDLSHIENIRDKENWHLDDFMGLTSLTF